MPTSSAYRPSRNGESAVRYLKFSFSYIKVFRKEFSTADKIIMHLVKNRSIMEEAINDLFICQYYNTVKKTDADKLQSVVNYLKS